MLCEIMRREDNGKKILVGCYSDTIHLKKKPTIVNARIVGGFQIDAGFLSAIEYKVETPTMRGEGKFVPPSEAIDEPGPGYAAFDAPFRTLIENENEEIQFSWRIDEKEWSLPVTWRFRFSEDARELSDAESRKLKRRYWNEYPEDPAIEGVEKPRKRKPRKSSALPSE